MRRYFAEAGKTGSLSRSRASCWMMTVALEPAAFKDPNKRRLFSEHLLQAGLPE